MILHDVIVAMCSAAAGAVVPIVIHKLSTAKDPDMFGFGLCEGLTEHKWEYSFARGGGFICPKCSRCIKSKTHPRFCPERSGHYHLRCDACAYEFAMVSWDVQLPKPQKESA